jgi:hypothetical protein
MLFQSRSLPEPASLTAALYTSRFFLRIFEPLAAKIVRGRAYLSIEMSPARPGWDAPKIRLNGTSPLSLSKISLSHNICDIRNYVTLKIPANPFNIPWFTC